MSRFSTILAFATAIGLSMPALAVPTTNIFIGNDRDPTPASPLTAFPNSTTEKQSWLATLVGMEVTTGTLSVSNLASGSPSPTLTIPFGTANTATVVTSTSTLFVNSATNGGGHQYSTLSSISPYVAVELQGLKFTFAKPILGFGMMITDMGEPLNAISITTKLGSAIVLASSQITCGSSDCVPTGPAQDGAASFIGVSSSTEFFDQIFFNIASSGLDGIGFDQVQVAAPEPSSLAVMGFATVALVGSVRRRNRAKADPKPSAHPA